MCRELFEGDHPPMGERETMINDMIEVVVLQTHKDINLI